jgi:signal transduction histidine kinase
VWGTASRDRLIQSTRWKLLLAYAVGLLLVVNINILLQRGYSFGLNEIETTVVLGIVSCIVYYYISTRILYNVQAEIRSHTQFLSDASHELRTPLTVMKTDLEIALRHPGDLDELKEVMSGTLDEVDRMHKIVEDLLLLSRNYLLRKGEERLQTNLGDLLKDILTKLESYAKTHNVRLKIEGLPATPLEVKGDRRKLLQSFLNVTKNAIEFSKPEGGTVSLIIKDIETTSILVIVQDEGIGISAHDLPFVFNRFYQVDKSRAWREAGGSGLGLSIAKWIVQGYGGNLSVESKLGKGTKMKFELVRVASERK